MVMESIRLWVPLSFKGHVDMHNLLLVDVQNFSLKYPKLVTGGVPELTGNRAGDVFDRKR